MKKVCLSIMIIVFIFSGNIFAWDDKRTHPRLTDFAIRKSKTDEYLKNCLNLDDGVKTKLADESVREWIQKGSFREDQPTCRASNHFHNPHTPQNDWTKSYMSDECWLGNRIRNKCIRDGYDDITSSVHWATGFTKPVPSVKMARDDNIWDWNHAREYYHVFLTGRDFGGTELASNESEKESYLADCFRAVGQVLHLLQDMSVPAHVRNDFKSHLKWVGTKEEVDEYVPDSVDYKFFVDRMGNKLEDYVARREELIGADPPVGIPRPSPSLTDFWDTNTYDGTNPDAEMIGLSEYANINFVSEYTKLTDEYAPDHMYYHPYPREDSTDLDTDIFPEIVTGEDNEPDERLYISKTGHGEHISHFLALTYFSLQMKRASENDAETRTFFRRTLSLDEKCYEDYAQKLLPRAVGHSADLLDYFFRGRMEITNVVPEMTASADKGFNRVTVFARNISPDGEDMSGGKLTLVIRYRAAQGNLFPPLPDFVPYADDRYSYIVREKAGSSVPIPGDQAQKFEFDLGSEELPLWAEETDIWLVYKGTLGDEEDSAVAVGYRQHVIPGMEISLPGTGVYALRPGPDPADAGFDPLTQGFDRLTFLVRNPDGPLEEGKLTLVVRYMQALDDPFLTTAPTLSQNFSHIVSEIGESVIPQETPAEREADLSGTQIPLWATSLYIWAVHTEGGDITEQTVTSVGFRDISEPTPHDIANVTDKICLLGSTADAGSGTAINIVDSQDNGGDGDGNPDEWDIFPHNMEDVYVRFSPADAPRYAEGNPDTEHLIPEIRPGESSRVFIISDYDYNLSCSYRITRAEAADIWHAHNYSEMYPPGLITWHALRQQYQFCDPPCCYDPDPLIAGDEICSDYARKRGSFRTFRENSCWNMLWIYTPVFPEGGTECPLEAYDTDDN